MLVAPQIGVGAVVWKGPAVLLVRRAHPPRAGSWSLPGGKQKLGETVEQAVHRELAEETGVTVRLLGLADVVDLMDYDDGGALRFHYTVLDYAALWLDGDPHAGDDAAEVAWALPADYDRFALTPLVRQVIDKAQRWRV